MTTDPRKPDDTDRIAVRIARDALDTEPSLWPELISRQCGNDSELRQRVEALLQAIAVAADPQTELPQAAGETTPVLQLGPFALLERIGQGGMGEVWRAARIQGGFAQQVAIKRVRGCQVGLIERFLREQQILARLNHTNIAHLIDGGVGGNGEPWLALEYVHGERITQWCNQHRLSMHARARLMLPVCEAIQYAHQNLVVHRDIKPANLLVSHEGVPKLLDFGIAKLLDPDDPGQTQTLVMTPAYAAPEQRLGQPITTATDIYQLGLVLCELLAGLLPAQTAAGNDHGNPDPHNLPGEAFRKLLSSNPEQATAIAGDRQLSVRNVLGILEGDLGWIIGKAMARHPADRYGSARELARDLENWLQRRTVHARRPDLLRRSWQLIARNPIASALGSLAVLAMVFGALGMHWQTERAVHEAQRANAVQEYLVDIFAAAAPGEPTSGLPDTRALLERGRVGVLDGFNERPETRAELLTVLARIHRQMGLYAEARELAEEAVTLRTRVLGADHPSRLASVFELGEVLRLSDTLSEAGPLFESALGLADRQPEQALLAARIRQSLGIVQSLSGEHAIGEQNLRQAGEVIAKELGPEHADYFHNRHALALALDRSEQFVASEAVYRDAVTLARTLFGEDHVYVANVLGDYATLLRPLGRYAEAESLLLEAVAIDRRVYDAPHPLAALHLANLASAQSSLDKTAQAEGSARESMQLVEALYGADSIDMAKRRINLSSLLIDLGRPAEAVEELMRSLAAFDASVEDYRLERGFVLTNLSRAHRALRQWDAARRYGEQAVAVRTELHGADHPRTAHSIAALARLELMTGNAAAGEQLFRRALLIAQGSLSPDHPELADRHLNLGEALQAQGRHQEAIAQFQDSLRICGQAELAADHQQVLDSRLFLASSLLATNRIDEAAEQAARITDFVDTAYAADERRRTIWQRLHAELVRLGRMPAHARPDGSRVNDSAVR